MSEIPEDVILAADAATKGQLGRRAWGREIIARAILAERKRCAAVARERMFDSHALAQATDIGRGCHLAASEIVEAIEVKT